MQGSIILKPCRSDGSVSKFPWLFRVFQCVPLDTVKDWWDHPCWDEGSDVLDVPDNLQLLRGGVRRYTREALLSEAGFEKVFRTQNWVRRSKLFCR